MPIVVSHDDKTEITGLTKDNAYHVVDLSSSVTEGCLGVLLQFVNTHTSTSKDAGFKTNSNTNDKDITIGAKFHQIIIAKLDNEYKLELKCEDSNVDIFIMAEFFEGIVLRDSDDWIEHQPGGGFWYTVTMSPLGDDTYADIEAVLLYGRGSPTFGARALGSVVERSAVLLDNHIFALPVKINSNGQFQIFIPSPACGQPQVWGVEIGYIKKEYDFKSFFNIDDLEPPTNLDWSSLSLKELLPEYSTHAIIRLVINYDKQDICGVRATGSSNEADILDGGIWAVYWPGIDSDRALEYRYDGILGAATVTFDAWGYIEGEPPPPPSEPENLELEITNRYVVSLGSIMLEVLNLTEVTDGDIIVTQLQHPTFAFGVVNSDGSSITTAINPEISGRTITINNSDLADDGLVLMVFGF